jgi:ABC-2 type transport system ATP-binding protein
MGVADVIEIHGLVKTFGPTRALDGLELSVHEGEVHGFLGPNGAGKSTTIRVLLGLLRKDAGEARLFGMDPWRDAAQLHRRLAYVPGDVNLWPNLTGGEVIDLLGRLRGGVDERRRAELLERFDLDPTKKGRSYSKGNRQKVALVAALASDVELLLLDEPTSGLDPIGTSEMKELIRDLREQGKTIVLSGHLLADMQDICDRIAILHRGELKELGKVSDLLTVQDVTQIKTRELPEAALHEIREVIARHGAELLAVDHPTTTLEELFLRIVRESDLHPGRRRVAEPARTAAPPADELAGTPSKP